MAIVDPVVMADHVMDEPRQEGNGGRDEIGKGIDDRGFHIF